MKPKLVDFQFNLEIISKLDVQKLLEFYFFFFCRLVEYGIWIYVKINHHIYTYIYEFAAGFARIWL